MASFLTSWPILACGTLASLAGQAFSFVTVKKTADVVVQGGIHCFNETMEAANQALCDSLFDSYENWNTVSKFALIGGPILLVLTVGGIGFRCIQAPSSRQTDAEAAPLRPPQQPAQRSTSIKVLDTLTSNVAKAFYGGMGALSFAYTLPGQYVLNQAAFWAGARIAHGNSSGITYIALKSAEYTAIAISQAAPWALLASFAYTNKRESIPQQS